MERSNRHLGSHGLRRLGLFLWPQTQIGMSLASDFRIWEANNRT